MVVGGGGSVTKSCLTLCAPMDCSLLCFSVREILQARTLEWVAISFSRGSSQPRDWTQVSCIPGGFSTNWATREAQFMWLFKHKNNNNKISFPGYVISLVQIRKWSSRPQISSFFLVAERSLTGYSSWGRKDSDITEQLTHFSK